VLTVTALLAAAALACGGLAAGRHLLRGRLRILLALRAAAGAEPEADPEPSARRRRTGSAAALRAALQRAGGFLLRGPVQRWAERCLRGTGLPLRPEEFLGLCAAGLVAGWGLGVLLPLPGFVRLLLAVLGPVSPPLYARRARQVRTARLSTQLGDTLMTLGNSLRAGHSLLQAVANAADQAAPPLGPELARLLREIAAGIPMDEALGRLLARTANPDLELLVTAILVQREVGGNLAEILDKISATIRARVSVQSHLRVVTAQSRMSGWVVGLLPVAVFAITTLIAPQIESTLTHDPLGRLVAGAAVILEVGGLLAIRKVVSIRY
jgi:tight adherence protein B